jgi:hypothetical protein
VVNFVKVGASEDASAVLEEICRWRPGDRHSFGCETSSSSYLRGGEGPKESGKVEVEKELVAQDRAG